LYIEVILPLPLNGTFTYFVPTEMESQIMIGSLVVVGFGEYNKYHRGLVLCIEQILPSTINVEKIKPILSVESSRPAIRQSQLRFWQWISNYYLCTLGNVFKTALPSSFHMKEKQSERCKIIPQSFSKLNELQKKIFDQIVENFQKKDVCLLHKNISLGEIEIYIHLIERTLKQNRQVLYLLPEIALTRQITNHLKQFFGEQLDVYHSKVNLNKRMEIWNNLLSDKQYQIILGVHSSIFLPFKNLGLIIIDEEHDSSYKQQKFAPYYHARNAAIVLATIHNSKVILGSATPSIESFYNVQIDKYSYINSNEYLEKTKPLPIISIDVKELKRKRKMKTIFSPLLIEHMKQKLKNGEQVILFQNRRGFAPCIFCKACNWTPKCHFCDINLTYHKESDRLTCHYCGRNYLLPNKCFRCGNLNLQSIGYGTEKVEEEVQVLFPGASVARMDLDTTKVKKSLKKTISNFESGQIQILIGTQIIYKGLNINKVGLIGILDVDTLMNFPDFRAYERTYQLILQMVEKVKRQRTQGELILQTSHPNHPLIKIVLQQNYKGMYDMQIEERILFKYPPFSRLIHILLYHKREELLCKVSDKYVHLLQEKLGDRVVGHDKPIVGKIKGLYIRKILLKIEVNASSIALRKILEGIHTKILKTAGLRRVIIHYDVDPI
jgi:primosomal protein N' (replication factor Y)